MYFLDVYHMYIAHIAYIQEWAALDGQSMKTWRSDVHVWGNLQAYPYFQFMAQGLVWLLVISSNI